MHKKIEIELLRALAVILVILNHYQIPPFKNGQIGVDAFFVISGFLISDLLINKKISLKTFYARRIKRILPLSSFVLIATYLSAIYLLPNGSIENLDNDIRAASLFFINFLLQHRAGDYFQASFNNSIFMHYWSLAVEEQFYLIWPLIIFIIREKLSRIWLGSLIALSILCSFIFTLVNYNQIGDRYYFNTFSHIWELMIGALLATFAERISTVKAIYTLPFYLFILITATLSIKNPLIPTFLAVVSTAVIIFLTPNFKKNKLLTPLVYLGSISFSLYLWHYVIFQLLLHHKGLPLTSKEKILGLVISLILSVISKHLIEDPVRKYNPNKLIITYLMGLSLVIIPLSLGSLKLDSNPKLDSNLATTTQNNYPVKKQSNKASNATSKATSNATSNASINNTSNNSSNNSSNNANNKRNKIAADHQRDNSNNAISNTNQNLNSNTTLNNKKQSSSSINNKVLPDQNQNSANNPVIKDPNHTADFEPPVASFDILGKEILSAGDDKYKPNKLHQNIGKIKTDIGYYSYPGCPIGATSCTKKYPGAKIIALYGDSHANMWYPALAFLGDTKKYQVALYAMPGCPPMYLPYEEFYTTDGRSKWQQCQSEVKANLTSLSLVKPYRIVVTASVNSGAGKWLHRYPTLLAQLKNYTDKVEFIGDIPYPIPNVTNCLIANLNQTNKCSHQAKDGAGAELEKTEKTLVLSSKINYIDPSKYLCYLGYCPVVIHNIIVYRDDIHFTRTYARWIGKIFIREFNLPNIS